jgi:hypothetical protein
VKQSLSIKREIASRPPESGDRVAMTNHGTVIARSVFCGEAISSDCHFEQGFLSRSNPFLINSEIASPIAEKQATVSQRQTMAVSLREAFFPTKQSPAIVIYQYSIRNPATRLNSSVLRVTSTAS